MQIHKSKEISNMDKLVKWLHMPPKKKGLARIFNFLSSQFKYLAR